MIKTIKLIILSFLWTAGWSAYFAATGAAVNATNLSIAFAPVIIILLLWFMLLLLVWVD